MCVQVAVDLVGLNHELLICGLEEFGFANIYRECQTLEMVVMMLVLA